MPRIPWQPRPSRASRMSHLHLLEGCDEPTPISQEPRSHREAKGTRH